MAATPREVVGAPSRFPYSPLGRGRSHPVYSLNERFRQHDCLSQRAVEAILHRVAREPSREPTIRIDRSSCERHWRNLCDVALFDGSHYMVAGNQELASQPNGELESTFCADQLGPAQRTRIL